MQQVHDYISQIKSTLVQLPHDRIVEMIDWLHAARTNQRQVFIMGNGGSASTATHFVCDLSKNTRRSDLPHFRVIGLADNMALLSALANDEGFENVFAGQLENLARPGDIAIAISTSGNSPNVIQAIKSAHNLGVRTIGMTGFDGGQLGKLVDLHLHVPSSQIEQVEDMHLLLEHMITKALREVEVAIPVAWCAFARRAAVRVS